MTPLAHYGHHHASSAAGWLADIAMRGVIYSTINRVMRSLTMTEVLVVAVTAIIFYIAVKPRS